MVEVTTPRPADQYRAIAQMRLILLRRSLRSAGSKVALVFRIIGWIFLLCVTFGVAVGVGFASYYGVSENDPAALHLTLGMVLFVWQAYVLLRSAINHDVGRDLLRFPLHFRTFCALWTFSGMFDIPTIIGAASCVAIFIGAGFGGARYLIALCGPLAFFIFNFTLSRTLVLWLEKLLARRRIREVVLALFSILGLLPQFLRMYGKNIASHIPAPVRSMSRWSPSTLLADALLPEASARHAWLSFAGVALCAAVFTLLVVVRLRKIYLGEDLHESTGAPRSAKQRQDLQQRRIAQGGSTRIPLIVWENEFRKLQHSGMGIFQLLTPLLMIVVFGIRWAHHGAWLLPGAIIYLSLDLGGRSANMLGTDGSGAQLYLLTPVSMRDVMFGKNLATFTIYAIQALLVVALCAVFSTFSIATAVYALCFACFAVSAYSSSGNAASFRSPIKLDGTKIDMATLRANRRSGLQKNNWRMLLVLFGVPALGAATLAAGAWFQQLWLSNAAMLVFAVLAAFDYRRRLRRLESYGPLEMEKALNILGKKA